jgi:apolipoprotein N-acyltransferase
VLVAAAGALQTLAFVHTAWWPLPLATLVLLVWRLDKAGPRHAAFLGWCYGAAWLAAGTWWLYVSMHQYGGLPAPLAVLAVAALSAALALYLALSCAVYALWRNDRMWTDAPLFAALWMLAELARGLIFTGFPWLASGYSQVDAPLAWAAPWLGVYGIGFLLAVIAAALASAKPVALLSLVLLAPALLPRPEFTHSAGSLSVTLLQTNVPQDEKFRVEQLPQTVAAAVQQLAASRGELVVGPETMIPLLPQQMDSLAPGTWEALRQRFSTPEQAALVGVPLGSDAEGYTNSVAGLAAGAPPYRYDKSHLVPFGEFIPKGFRWFTEAMNIPLGDFRRGALVQPSFAFKGQLLAPNICYEDLFGEELAARFADEARAPTILVNISNIGWFGHTVALPQHLHISRMRSLELERPMLRATNTGVTAIIDHRGVVRGQLAPFTSGVLEGRVEGRRGLTPYAAWVTETPLWLVAGGVLGLLLLRGALDPRKMLKKR